MKAEKMRKSSNIEDRRSKRLNRSRTSMSEMDRSAKAKNPAVERNKTGPSLDGLSAKGIERDIQTSGGRTGEVLPSEGKWPGSETKTPFDLTIAWADTTPTYTVPGNDRQMGGTPADAVRATNKRR